MCKQTNATFRRYCSQLFAHIINCAALMQPKNPASVGYIWNNWELLMGLLPNCACAGNAGKAFSTNAAKRSRHASRHTCRDACRDRWLAVSFGVGGGENVPGIPGACATRNFTYLVRGPWYNHVRFTTTGKYDSDGKRWYFRFDYDDKTNYSWTPTIAYFTKKNKKVTERTKQTIDILSAEYTPHAFTDARSVYVFNAC